MAVLDYGFDPMTGKRRVMWDMGYPTREAAERRLADLRQVEYEWKMGRITRALKEKPIAYGAIERVLLAAIYRDTGGLHEEVLRQTRAGGFAPVRERMLYVALERMVRRGDPINLDSFWEETVLVAGEHYPQWFGEEVPLSERTREELWFWCHDIAVLTPSPEQVQVVLAAYHEQSPPLVQGWIRTVERWERRQRAAKDNGG